MHTITPLDTTELSLSDCTYLAIQLAKLDELLQHKLQDSHVQLGQQFVVRFLLNFKLMFLSALKLCRNFIPIRNYTLLMFLRCQLSRLLWIIYKMHLYFCLFVCWHFISLKGISISRELTWNGSFTRQSKHSFHFFLVSSGLMRATLSDGSNDVERDETKTREKKSKENGGRKIEADWLWVTRRLGGGGLVWKWPFPFLAAAVGDEENPITGRTLKINLIRR